jgi:hypothetical protein
MLHTKELVCNKFNVDRRKNSKENLRVNSWPIASEFNEEVSKNSHYRKVY